jgi:hypothetical protein
MILLAGIFTATLPMDTAIFQKAAYATIANSIATARTSLWGGAHLISSV